MADEITFNPRGVNKVLRLLNKRLPAVLNHYFYIHQNRFELWVSMAPSATSIVFTKEDLDKTPEAIVDEVMAIVQAKLDKIEKEKLVKVKATKKKMREELREQKRQRKKVRKHGIKRHRRSI